MALVFPEVHRPPVPVVWANYQIVSESS
jgi:hypothetical protein